MDWVFAFLLVGTGFLIPFAILNCVSEFEKKKLRKAFVWVLLFLLGLFFLFLVYWAAQRFSFLQVRSGCVLLGLLLGIHSWGFWRKESFVKDRSSEESGGEV